MGHSPRIDFLRLIREHAEDTDRTLPELFEAAGVALSQWYRWKAGETSPTVATVELILAVKPKRRASA
jgi:hypothetical protein